MIDKLFESLDENVFTPELKATLAANFNEAVEIKASAIAEEKIEEEIDALSEKSEAHVNHLSEQAESFVAMKQEEMLEKVDDYLEVVVEKLIAETKDAMDESLKSEKADMVIEAFDSFIVAAGTDVARIVEAKEDSSSEVKLSESITARDSLVDENIKLIKENESLIQMGVIAELKEGLSIVEAEKFGKLAKLVEFEKSSDYSDKLEVIKESVMGSKVEDKKLTERTVAVSSASYAHLI